MNYRKYKTNFKNFQIMVTILSILIPTYLLILSMPDCSSHPEKSFCRVSLSYGISSMRCFDVLSQIIFSVFTKNKKIASQKGSFLSKLKALTFQSYSCEHEMVFTDESTHFSYLLNCSPSNSKVYDFEDAIDLSNITELEISNISDFRLDSFPNSLKILSITNSDIKFLPQNFLSKFDFLNELILSKINLHEIKLEHFKNLKYLTKLDLSNNFIQDIPKEFFHDISELKILNLSGNNITFIDEIALQFLTNLKILDLSSCFIESWNSNKFSRNLISLNLSNNNISHIPNLIMRTINILEDLNLSNNRVDRLHYVQFWNLNNLKNLDISRNRIKFFGIKFSILRNLEILNLSGNQISCLDDLFFKKFKNLRILNISHNDISNFKINIYKNQNNLEILDASYNNIGNVAFNRSLTDADMNITTNADQNTTELGCASSKLKEIKFDHNNLQSVNFLRNISCFSNSLHNFSIYLNHNEISEFDETLLTKHDNYCQQNYSKSCNLHNISNIFLDISFNPMKCDCHLYEFHQYLKEFSGMRIYTFTNLQNLRCKTPQNLVNHTIFLLHDDAFSCLPAHDFASKQDYEIQENITKNSSNLRKISCRVSLLPRLSSVRCFNDLSQNFFSIFTKDEKIASQGGSFLSKLKALKFKSYLCEHKIVFLDKSFRSNYFINCSSGNLKLNDFEDTIDLAIITELKISNISDFPLDSFSNSIEILSITNANINFLPNKILSRFFYLNELTLHKINLREIEREHFINLKYLTKLDLSNNFIQEIPKDVFNDISGLRILNLSRNNITIRDEFALQFLTNLKVLDFSSCFIHFLHENIFSNSSYLISLNLSNNNIEYIPTNIFEPLKILEDLNLSDNKISRFYYTHLWKLKKLKYLDVSRNRIQDLDPEFSRVRNLEIINLSRNKIVSINELHFIRFKKLRIFNFSHNKINNLKINFYKSLNNLEILDASYNNIEEVVFDRSLTNANNYGQISYEHNKSTFDCSASKLKQIKLDHNELKNVNFLRDIACFFASLHVSISLNEIQISELDINLLMKHGNYCQQKYIGSCNLYSISNIFLDITFNPMKCENHLYDDEFSCLVIKDYASKCDFGIRVKDKKTFVNCTNQNFNEVSIVPPKETTVLYFNQNHLKHLKSLNQDTWINITDLHLDDNDIGTLEGWNIPLKLHYLSLRGNRLKSISLSLMEFINKQNHFQLLFERNDRNCDCDSGLFKKFLINKRVFVPDVEKIFCDIENNGEIILTPLVSVSEDILCAEELLSKLTQNVLISLFSILFLLMGIALFIYFKMRMEVNSFFYVHCSHLCCFKSEENNLKHRIFDAFVAYSNYDRHIVLDLLKELEEKEPWFQLCIHERDWKAGNDIMKNILESVQNSKRTILVMSENFIASPWFKVELTAATSEGRMNPFIIILLEKSSTLQNMDKHFRRTILKKTYLVWGEKWFWEKLRYAMPHKKSEHIASTSV